MAVAAVEFPAMGSVGRVLVVGENEAANRTLAEVARRRIHDLEQRWSRFVATSELCRLNASAGGDQVSVETASLIALGLDAWSRTGGLFDLTVLTALEAAGYDRSFEYLDATAPGPDGIRIAVGPTQGCDRITVESGGRVTLPTDLRLDLGGVGKGRAADLVVTQLLELGADGACVDLGGDVRVAGRAPDPDGWAVALDGPGSARLGVVDLLDGGVATSSVRRRRWSGSRGMAHHLIDPRTGEPSAGDLLSVSVVAAEAVWAEVFAKAALVAGSADGVALLVDAGLAAVLVTNDHQVITAGDIDRFIRPGAADHLEEAHRWVS